VVADDGRGVTIQPRRGRFVVGAGQPGRAHSSSKIQRVSFRGDWPASAKPVGSITMAVPRRLLTRQRSALTKRPAGVVLAGQHAADQRPPGDRTDDAVNGDRRDVLVEGLFVDDGPKLNA
jgi:hypothetical protein